MNSRHITGSILDFFCLWNTAIMWTLCKSIRGVVSKQSEINRQNPTASVWRPNHRSGVSNSIAAPGMIFCNPPVWNQSTVYLGGRAFYSNMHLSVCFLTLVGCGLWPAKSLVAWRRRKRKDTCDLNNSSWSDLSLFILLLEFKRFDQFWWNCWCGPASPRC